MSEDRLRMDPGFLDQKLSAAADTESAEILDTPEAVLEHLPPALINGVEIKIFAMGEGEIKVDTDQLLKELSAAFQNTEDGTITLQLPFKTAVTMQALWDQSESPEVFEDEADEEDDGFEAEHALHSFCKGLGMFLSESLETKLSIPNDATFSAPTNLAAWQTYGVAFKFRANANNAEKV